MLEQGKLIEDGEPHELLSKQAGIFSGMVEQTGPSSAAYLRHVARDASFSRAAAARARSVTAEVRRGALSGPAACVRAYVRWRCSWRVQRAQCCHYCTDSTVGRWPRTAPTHAALPLPRARSSPTCPAHPGLHAAQNLHAARLRQASEVLGAGYVGRPVLDVPQRSASDGGDDSDDDTHDGGAASSGRRAFPRSGSEVGLARSVAQDPMASSYMASGPAFTRELSLLQRNAAGGGLQSLHLPVALTRRLSGDTWQDGPGGQVQQHGMAAVAEQPADGAAAAAGGAGGAARRPSRSDE